MKETTTVDARQNECTEANGQSGTTDSQAAVQEGAFCRTPISKQGAAKEFQTQSHSYINGMLTS